jgi:hypothetical protein
MRTNNKRIDGKDMINMEELKGKWFKLTRSAYNDYITFVNGNENDSFELSEKKLNRNIQCGSYINTRENNIEIFGYGGLRLGLRGGCILFIENRVKPYIDIDRELKDKLDVEYGLKVAENKKIIKEDVKIDFQGISFLHKIMKMVGLHS